MSTTSCACCCKVAGNGLHVLRSFTGEVGIAKQMRQRHASGA
eukprot:CAMPEP_0114693000 /NCGR_PEP_ID=MMETSP0191-20121206/68571_1 /TAXON_ID=126664 /ORGANISM="Sorites sp." /LENGTH=41 /DNA_ID= /DNA_START= /DNA_END= /DNA_ORIENTATION=